MHHQEQLDDLERKLLARLEVDARTGCWRWQGATASNGYGHLSWRGKDMYTHRASAIVFLEFNPSSGLLVLHQCDEPICLNPDHLRIGTQKDKMSEAAAKGRMGKKLTEDQVAVIKYKLPARTQHSLALEYGVSTTAIGQIARGETWKTVAPRNLTPSDDASDQADQDGE